MDSLGSPSSRIAKSISGGVRVAAVRAIRSASSPQSVKGTSMTMESSPESSIFGEGRLEQIQHGKRQVSQLQDGRRVRDAQSTAGR